jgi:hypothetical protein
MREMIDTSLRGGRNSIVLLVVSQASSALPSDKSRVKVKTIKWLEAEVLAKGR